MEIIPEGCDGEGATSAWTTTATLRGVEQSEAEVALDERHTRIWIVFAADPGLMLALIWPELFTIAPVAVLHDDVPPAM
ncbi:MAG TPA: hypothetical protein VEC19_09500 [Usitatibacter sp.]|nr:hypothetical protein [Usitatibacter sp.]